jgi:hypothetical protein
MSTDPAFTVEWTVPTDEDEWGGDGSGASSCGGGVESEARTTTEGSDREQLRGRDPENLPPAPVLAARVDHLRSDRAAAERRANAIRDRYERELEARNEEIRELRASRSRLRTFLDRLRNLF